MLAFFRRILSSGLAVAILGVILIAFVVTGIGTQGGGITGGARADAVATVGGKPVTVTDLATRAQQELRVAARQQPGITMSQLLAGIGGAGALVEQYVGAQVLTVWAARHGVVASDRLVDGEIGSIPAFLGPDGKPDRRQIDAVLSQQRMSYPALRQSIRDDLLRRQLLVPIVTGTRAPAAFLNPYAMLILAKRQGAIGLVPARPDGIAAPTDAEAAGWYQAHLARYSLPRRRVIRYAPIGPDSVKATPPTDAEIAAYYTANAASYAASETRAVSQVVLPTEAAAKDFAGRIAGGTPFAKAAADAGFAAADIALGAVTRTALATASSARVADAVFALPSGGTTPPLPTALGFAVDHVEAVTARPARSLAQARDEIAAALTKKKAQDAVGTLVAQVQDAASDGSSFDDIVARYKLAAVTTPPLVADGTAPATPAFRPDATLTALLKAANDATPDDQPTLETVGPDGRYALLGVASIMPAAPLPLAQVKPRVARDMTADRAASRARATAALILARVAKGQPVAAAFAAAGLPAPQPVTLSQVDLARAGDRAPPVLRTLFQLAAGKARIVPAPNGAGWFVVRLERILPGDAAQLPSIVAATRSELSQNIGEEFAREFANAARVEVRVSRNPAAIAQLDQQLRGGPGSAPDR